MSKRDMLKTAKLAGTIEKETIIPEAYQMSVTDLSALYEQYMASKDQNKFWVLIDTAFRFGFVMGNRATINRGIKRI